MGRMKRKNRKSEFLYQKAEWLNVLNTVLNRGAYPKAALDEGWKLLLTNQFHDILPGSSIKPVYEDADADYEKVFKIGNDAAGSAQAGLTSAISGNAGDIVVFNPAGFDRADIAFAETAAAGIKNSVSQRTADGRLCFMATVPAKGWAVFSPSETVSEGETAAFNGNVLESPFYRVTLDKNGFFRSVYDKKNGREVLTPGKAANLLRVYEDLPLNDDAWDINVFYREKFTDMTDMTSCALVENGPVYATLRQTRRFNKSTLTQDIRFYRDIPRIDFITTADWHETHVLLKAHFPVDVNTDKATYEIQFGALTRNTHENTMWDFAKFEVCGHKWADVCESDYGAAVLNDCKYGYGAQGSELSLSLIKCAAGPNVDADREAHSFTYSFLPHKGDTAGSDVVRQGFMLNVPLETAVKSDNGGALPQSFSFVSDLSGNCVVDTVKRAEDDGQVIVRLYEPYGRRCTAKLRFGVTPAKTARANLAENEIESLTADADGTLSLPLREFEIVTMRLRFNGKAGER